MGVNRGRTPGGEGGQSNGYAGSPTNTPPKSSQRFNGQDVTVTRDPLTNNDTIFHDNSPWYHHAYRSPSTVEPGNWNASGPVPMSLHFRTFRYRREAGQFNSDTTGMHTMIPAVRPGKEIKRPDSSMTPGRSNRLTTALYRGQSYSDTTQVQ